MKKVRIHSLRNKLLAAFLCIVAIFTLIGAIGYRMSLKNGYDLTVDAVSTSLRHIERESDKVLQEALRRAEEVAADPDLQTALRKDLPEEKAEIYKERLHFNNWLYYECIRVSHLDGLYVLGENGAVFHATYSFRAEEYRTAEWYRKTVEERKPVWIEPHSGSELGNNLDIRVMSIAVPILDRASTKVLGVTVAEIKMKDLSGMIFEDPAFAGSLFILDGNRRIVYAQNPSEEENAADAPAEVPEDFLEAAEEVLTSGTAESDTEDYAFLTIKGERYIAVFSELSDSPWELMSLVSADSVLKDIYRLRRAVILMGILLVVVGVWFSFFVSSGIVKPVHAMQKVMKEVEKGDFTARMETAGEDEIGDLSRGLNHMIGRVEELLENEKKTQQKLKEADFNALQSQINPHFLYNTLDSINWMARMGRTDQVEEMIDSLTSFLRIGLSRGQTFIPLRDELKHVESYFQIQKVRYSSLLSYEIRVPEELYDLRMIKMTLQPLVENALYHGIKEKDEPGTITIEAGRKEDALIITVKDDGLGMTPERLDEVRKMMETLEAKNRDAYGIINVQSRIRSYFGNEYGLHFDSTYGKGTTVTVYLPGQEMNT